LKAFYPAQELTIGRAADGVEAADRQTQQGRVDARSEEASKSGRNRHAAYRFAALGLRACGQEKVEPIAKSIRPILLSHGADLRLGRIFSGRYTGQFLATVRYPDWERLGRTMNATVSDAEFQKAVAEADRLCELQSRSIDFFSRSRARARARLKKLSSFGTKALAVIPHS
jgi:hypothetical protein